MVFRRARGGIDREERRGGERTHQEEVKEGNVRVVHLALNLPYPPVETTFLYAHFVLNARVIVLNAR